MYDTLQRRLLWTFGSAAPIMVVDARLASPRYVATWPAEGRERSRSLRRGFIHWTLLPNLTGSPMLADAIERIRHSIALMTRRKFPCAAGYSRRAGPRLDIHLPTRTEWLSKVRRVTPLSKRRFNAWCVAR